MIIRNSIKAVVITVVLSTNALAGNEIVGSGNCSAWNKGMAMNDEMISALQVSWVQGFLSGMNMQLAESGLAGKPIPEGSKIRAFMDFHCSINPKHPVSSVALSYFRLIGK